ncbi:hypothetical protein chiPu_0026498 [Chiloscyllium punctatum]|uniref:Uncharacterized protein n=1 Tax=Chiloscyllium punctatum TaxID=137246 RepID=A0A401TJM0_CHIPU|nr:hypothetical protein [Chiloscyllium punctatum]
MEQAFPPLPRGRVPPPAAAAGEADRTGRPSVRRGGRDWPVRPASPRKPPSARARVGRSLAPRGAEARWRRGAGCRAAATSARSRTLGRVWGRWAGRGKGEG